ncbi:MAG: diaminopimelate epimerase [Pyrinomonadaceae bacterium]
MTISFCKFHGFGNDYIVIERENIRAGLDQIDLALSICQRHTGVGSDGIAIIDRTPTGDGDFFCEIVNPDGSLAGFSGNGTRCAVSYIYYKRLWHEPTLKLETRSGLKNYRLIEEMSPGHYWFEAEIGHPRFKSSEIPIATSESLDSVIDLPVVANGKEFLVSGVNVGNPVACVFVDEFDPMWRIYGRALEKHEIFPERANIVFVKVVNRENIEIKIWERGAGETSSSGTCVSAAAALSALTKRTGREVAVHTEGGKTEFVWRDDGEMLITGRADLAFCGEWTA